MTLASQDDAANTSPSQLLTTSQHVCGLKRQVEERVRAPQSAIRNAHRCRSLHGVGHLLPTPPWHSPTGQCVAPDNPTGRHLLEHPCRKQRPSGITEASLLQLRGSALHPGGLGIQQLPTGTTVELPGLQQACARGGEPPREGVVLCCDAPTGTRSEKEKGALA